MRFDLSKIKNCSVTSFDLDELNGRDSIDAAARAIGPGGDEGSRMSSYQANMQHRNQLVAQSISKVNDELVQRPYMQWEQWTLRTQEFVLAAYMRLNEATKAEVDGFIMAHFAAPEGQSALSSSRSGSGSPGT